MGPGVEVYGVAYVGHVRTSLFPGAARRLTHLVISQNAVKSPDVPGVRTETMVERRRRTKPRDS
ncbi:hypothetical protein OV320_5593 [Actinobacteria bacterium OV320]|nr:hypothetical protein OV320_5593 [Actinobacteria bacterium OV320]